jgi:aspartyl-tRNA synthetase
VIAFLLNQKAQDLLMQAPVPAARLRELHLKIDLPAKKV